MNIVGIGIDILKIDRVAKVPNFERFTEYILTKNEIETMKKSRDEIQFLASRFSAKEALIKAYPEKINYQDIETKKDGDKFMCTVHKNKPELYVINSSISHSLENTVAVATVSQK